MTIKYKEIERTMSITEILNFISELDILSENYDNKIRTIGLNLIQYYKDKGRHSYSEVSTFLYSIKEDRYDYIYENIKKVSEYLDEYDKDNNTSYKSKIVKLEDHIKLELIRMDSMRKIDDLTEKIEVETNDYEEKFNELKDVYNNQKENIEGLNNQIISIIGIFSAIVITFFGGINFIESVLNSIGQVSKYRFVLATFIVGFVMFNTIFMLLNFIAKLTDKNIRSYCEHYVEENKCNPNCKNKKYVKCVKLKHPTIYWVNTVFIIGVIGITLMYYLDYFNIPTKILN